MPPKPSQRKKTFTGCWTCRNRKLKCDLGRPECNRCLKSKIPCEGYDIKLRWSTKSERGCDEEYFQRRNIGMFISVDIFHFFFQVFILFFFFFSISYQFMFLDFVVYPPEMTFHTYDEMDTTLAKLHSPALISNETKVLGPFGVFQGVKSVSKKSKPNSNKRKRKDTESSSSSSSSATSTPVSNKLLSTSNKNSELNKSKDTISSHALLDKSKSLSTSSASSTPLSLPSTIGIKPTIDFDLNSDFLLGADIQPPVTNTTNHLDSSALSSNGIQNTNQNTQFQSNNNSLSDNLLQEHSDLFDHPEAPFNLDSHISSVHMNDDDTNLGNHKNQNINQNQDSGSILDFDNILSQIDNTLNVAMDNSNDTHTSTILSFSKQIADTPGLNEFSSDTIQHHDSINQIRTNSQNEFSFSQNSQTGSISISNNIDSNVGRNLTSSNNNHISNVTHSHSQSNNRNSNNGDDNESSLVMIPMTSLVNKYLSTDKNYGIPTNTMYFSPEARQLLHHYINHVSRLMTVVTHDSTPWKTMYLPRAINAIGCLTALGFTSPTRNTLLHALLSVSSYHLASKFPSNSEQRSHYDGVGLRLKNQAVRYLQQCSPFPTVDSEYKDLITTFLSMVTIDVVSGEMNTCSSYLKMCKTHILSQISNPQSRQSKETQILHRIYAFLSLLQDSTNITPNRLDSTVLDESEWDYIREMEDLGLNSPVADTTPSSSPNLTNNIPTSTLTTDAHIHFSPASSTSPPSSYSTKFGLNDSSDPNKTKNNSTKNSLSSSLSQFGFLDFSGIEDPQSLHSIDHTINGSSVDELDLFGGNGLFDSSLFWSNPSSPGNNSQPSSAVNGNISDNVMTNNPNTSISPVIPPTSKHVKNFYDTEIISTYAMYGIPDSLTILFNRVVRLARQRCYLNAVGKAPQNLIRVFNSKCEKIDMLLKQWLLKFKEEQIPPEFKDDTRIAFYLHTIAFYHSVCIYHYTVVRDVPSETLQDKVKLVLGYLQNMLQLNRNRPSPVIVPLLFPAFIAACETCEGSLAREFDAWFDQISIDGLGTYSQARKVVKEVWNRRRLGLTNCHWYEVIHDLNVSILLS